MRDKTGRTLPRLSPEARRETQTDDEKVERGKTAPRHGTTDGLKREGAFAINMLYMGRTEGGKAEFCLLFNPDPEFMGG